MNICFRTLVAESQPDMGLLGRCEMMKTKVDIMISQDPQLEQRGSHSHSSPVSKLRSDTSWAWLFKVPLDVPVRFRVLARPKSSLQIARMNELYSNASGYYNWHSQRLYEVLRLVTYPLVLMCWRTKRRREGRMVFRSEE